MSYFIRAEDFVVDIALEFSEVTTDSLQQFSCKDGETAGFQIRELGKDAAGNPLYISQIFDCSSGAPVLAGSTYALAGMDLTGGLFSSGCLPDGPPLSAATVFYKVDYT